MSDMSAAQNITPAPLAAEVHLLWASQEYEAPVLLGIYADRAEADRVCAACTEYQKSQPPYPTSEAVPDEVLDAFYAAKDAWAAGHPGGSFGEHADGYRVGSMPVIGLQDVVEAATGGDMWLCESRSLALKPGVAYRFKVDITCEKCVEFARETRECLTDEQWAATGIGQ